MCCVCDLLLSAGSECDIELAVTEMKDYMMKNRKDQGSSCEDCRKVSKLKLILGRSPRIEQFDHALVQGKHPFVILLRNPLFNTLTVWASVL